jgi:hypothetical protein
MERKEYEEVLLKIQEIKSNTRDLQQNLSDLSIISREELIGNIYNDIIVKHHPIFKERDITDTKGHPKREEALPSDEEFVNNIISNLKSEPAKKVIYLKQFLDNLSDISDSDRKVVLKSLKSTEIEDLQKKMKSLIDIFNLDLSE